VRLEREGLKGGPQEGEDQEEIFEQAGFGVSEEDACCKAKRGSLTSKTMRPKNDTLVGRNGPGPLFFLSFRSNAPS
jgi:hypothetical protein